MIVIPTIFFIKICMNVNLSLTSVLKLLFTKSIYFCASNTSVLPTSHLSVSLYMDGISEDLFGFWAETARYGTVINP